MVVFEVSGAAVTQGAVQPGAVVPGDVLHDGAAGHSAGRPRLGVDQLALERAEKRLGDGVIPALTRAPGRQGDLAVPARAAQAAEVYWQPRSEWKITPGAGSRAATALARAPATSSVRR